LNSSTPWLMVPSRRPAARRRLVCLPHAGGSASVFRGWDQLLSPSVELQLVQYPGRANRRREPLVSAMAPLAEAIAEAIAQEQWEETFLFGHSMGAAVAFEVTRMLEASGRKPPRLLFVSERGFLTADAADAAGDGDSLEQGICRSLQDMGGPHAEAMKHPELREIYLPVIRNDFVLMKEYRPVPVPPISAQIVAIHGDRGNRADARQIAAWAAATTGGFCTHQVRGDHFYLMREPGQAVNIAQTHMGVATGPGIPLAR
jgi:pyochelin biosynthesis protein PchC